MDQRKCLALNIYHESRGEITEDSYENWLVVAMVTRNRVDSKHYPDSWCSVVWQNYQFAWTRDDKPDNPNYNDPIEARVWADINMFVSGFMANHRYIKDPTEGALYFHSGHPSNTWWSSHYELVGKFGGHYVYK